MRLARNLLGLTLTIVTIVLSAGTARADARSARLEGIRLYEAGRFPEAIPYFNQVLARKGRDLEILIKRGAVIFERTNPRKRSPISTESTSTARGSRQHLGLARSSRRNPPGFPNPRPGCRLPRAGEIAGSRS